MCLGCDVSNAILSDFQITACIFCENEFCINCSEEVAVTEYDDKNEKNDKIKFDEIMRSKNIIGKKGECGNTYTEDKNYFTRYKKLIQDCKLHFNNCKNNKLLINYIEGDEYICEKCSKRKSKENEESEESE